MESIVCTTPYVGDCPFSQIQLSTPGSTTLIRTRMGSGKTTATFDILAETPRWLYIVPRVSMARFAKKLAEERGMLDVVCYLDVRGPLYVYDQVICSIDSLHRLSMQDDTTGHIVTSCHFPIVVLDEVGTTVSHIPATTVRRPRVIWNLLRTQLETANRLIMMDAHVRPHQWEAFKHLSARRHSACKEIVSESKHGGGTVTFLRSEAELRDRIVEQLACGGRAVIASSRKDWIKSCVVDLIRRVERPLDCVV